nr:uncharacterized protein LOC109165047 [Ipomoea trifida]
MAKGTKGRHGITSQQCRSTPYPLPSQKKCSKHSQKIDWEDVTCSVCMEYPHNAVLLLCSSHDKGCRPYMCGTSYRYSNCLDQYRKAYTKDTPAHETQPLHGLSISSAIPPFSTQPTEKCEIAKLACPLCRGQVKGWTVVETAREFLNAKKRSCMQDGCSFVGNYREIRKHVRAVHPAARPREVDPLLEQKWRRLVGERERDDVISTITSSMPGAMVFGDYVIEGGHYGFYSEDEDGFEADAMENHSEGFRVGVDGSNLMNVLLLLQAFGSAGNLGSDRDIRQQYNSDPNNVLDEGAVGIDHNLPVVSYDCSSEDSDHIADGHDNGTSLVGRARHQGLGDTGRRRRRRQANGGQR